MNLLLVLAIATAAPLDTATFAGGCFWSMERAFDQVDGVVSVTVGYTGGHTAHPSYEQVSTGQTGHRESVQVVYDPRQITYERLVDAFWHDIDPTQADGQFCDHGDEYRTAIFYRDTAQHRVAAASRRALERRFAQPVVTEIVRATAFYPAEEYHQHDDRQQPIRYRMHGVAELHEAARGREHPSEDRPVALHDADRGAVGACRFASGAPVRRRPGADRIALLHQLRRAAFHSGGAPAGGGLRAVPTAVSDGAALIKSLGPDAISA